MSTTRRRPTPAFAVLSPTAGLLAALALAAPPAHATPPFVAAARLLPPAAQQELLGGRVFAEALTVQPDGSVTFGTVALSALESARDEHGRVSVGTLRFPLLNRSTQAMGAVRARTDYMLTGRGVAVAVVDTGLDVRHADFRNADGSTRVAWLLDYSRPARGVHAELETRFGFVRDNGTRYGAVYSAADLDALLSAETTSGVRSAELPEDEVGHGTHVMSIAAGNGLATGAGLPAGRYVGVAPDATLIVVRASAAGQAAFSDAAVVAGATFATDRATALGIPVVVNLSLGSQVGTHDGNSPLERGLAALVPPGTPGRAVVVAAGNQGSETGVHSRADLFERVPNEMPLSVSAGSGSDVVVIDLAYEGTADVAVRFPNGQSTPWVFEGQARGYATGDGVASIANATDNYVDLPRQPSLTPSARVRAATVLLAADAETGTPRREGTYTLLVRGEGIVHAYVNEGSSGVPEGRFVGDLNYGTVSVPATSPDLVSVGSTVSRTSWETTDRRVVRLSEMLTLGAVSDFSARGPNRVNEPRPDLLAPGEFIVAALSAQAGPDEPLSIFRDAPGTSCVHCFVAEDGVHAVAQGTSAATPHVTGAMALLLQVRPTATQDELRAVLADTAVGAVGGSARWNPAEGWGSIAVDVAAARWLGQEGGAPGGVDAARSEVTVPVESVAPGEPLTVTVRLADGAGVTVAGEHAVTVRADRGAVLGVSALGEGRYAARWRASGMAPGERALFTATADGVVLAAQPGVRVVRDVVNGEAGGSVSGGGCSARGRAGGAGGMGWVVAGVLVVAVVGRKRVTPRGSAV